MSLFHRVIQSRSGGRVQRCHGIPHQGSYSNAEHSWGVAMLMFYLWPEDFPRLAAYCLAHDVPEAWVGDIPAPVGRYAGVGSILEKYERVLCKSIGLPFEKDLPKEDYTKLKACDALEFWLWAREQAAMGNQFALESQREVERYFKESPLPQRALEFFKEAHNNHVCPRQSGVIKEIQCQLTKPKSAAATTSAAKQSSTGTSLRERVLAIWKAVQRNI